MVSRENRVILGSFALLVLAVVGLVVVDNALGIALYESPLAMFLLVTGLAIVVPQLYLAATDSEISPRTRVRFAVVVTGLFALAFADDPGALQDLLILAIGGGAFLGLVCYEFVAGYRSRAADRPAKRAQ